MPNSYDIDDVPRLQGRFWINPTQLKAEAAAAATTLTLVSVTGLAATDVLLLGEPPADLDAPDYSERVTVSSIAGLVVTLTAATKHAHHVGELVGELTDPTTVTLKIKRPSAVIDSYTFAAATVSRDSDFAAVGAFFKSLDLTGYAAGVYHYRWIGTGAVQTGEERSFTIRATQF